MSILLWAGVAVCSWLWLEHCWFFRTPAGEKSPETGRKERGSSDTTLWLAKKSQRILKLTFLVRSIPSWRISIHFVDDFLSLSPSLLQNSKFISSKAHPKLQSRGEVLFSRGIQLQLLSCRPASSPWQHEGEWQLSSCLQHSKWILYGLTSDENVSAKNFSLSPLLIFRESYRGHMSVLWVRRQNGRSWRSTRQTVKLFNFLSTCSHSLVQISLHWQLSCRQRWVWSSTSPCASPTSLGWWAGPLTLFSHNREISIRSLKQRWVIVTWATS